MSGSMIVLPLTDDLRRYLQDHDVPVPEDAVGTAPTVELIEAAMRDLDWPYGLTGSEDRWHFIEQDRAGRCPPVSELSLAADGSLSFRLGPAFGPWAIARHVARVCGPQVAFDAEMGAYVVVTADISYELFYETLFEVAPNAGDGDWIPIRAGESL